MKNKLVKKIATFGVIVSMFSTVAYAGTSYSYYRTTVGKFNGNGYTSYQTKSIGGANGNIKSTKVGGGYSVDARMNSSVGNGEWARDIKTGTKTYLPGNSNQLKGTSVRLQFSNDVTTPVDVQVSGSWQSN